jgi:hypothetical protein
MSPVEMWGMPRSAQSIFAWVPLPAPGKPRKIKRFTINIKKLSAFSSYRVLSPFTSPPLASNSHYGISTGVGRDVQLQPFKHEGEQVIPTLEIERAGERPHVIEEGFASGQMGTQEFVLLIQQIQHRVEQQGQNVEGGEKRGQMLFPVTKIVLQVVALGLEGVVGNWL